MLLASRQILMPWAHPMQNNHKHSSGLSPLHAPLCRSFLTTIDILDVETGGPIGQRTSSLERIFAIGSIRFSINPSNI
jgi:hypothetical protein